MASADIVRYCRTVRAELTLQLSQRCATSGGNVMDIFVQFVPLLVIGLIIGGLLAAAASKVGRSPMLWFSHVGNKRWNHCTRSPERQMNPRPNDNFHGIDRLVGT
jgi:hypothetical protein